MAMRAILADWGWSKWLHWGWRQIADVGVTGLRHLLHHRGWWSLDLQVRCSGLRAGRPGGRLLGLAKRRIDMRMSINTGRLLGHGRRWRLGPLLLLCAGLGGRSGWRRRTRRLLMGG